MTLELVKELVLMNALFKAIVLKRKVSSRAFLSGTSTTVIIVDVALNNLDSTEVQEVVKMMLACMRGYQDIRYYIIMVPFCLLLASCCSKRK